MSLLQLGPHFCGVPQRDFAGMEVHDMICDFLLLCSEAGGLHYTAGSHASQKSCQKLAG
jgi:hypothetical protein